MAHVSAKMGHETMKQQEHRSDPQHLCQRFVASGPRSSVKDVLDLVEGTRWDRMCHGRERQDREWALLVEDHKGRGTSPIGNPMRERGATRC